MLGPLRVGSLAYLASVAYSCCRPQTLIRYKQSGFAPLRAMISLLSYTYLSLISIAASRYVFGQCSPRLSHELHIFTEHTILLLTHYNNDDAFFIPKDRQSGIQLPRFAPCPRLGLS